jgi:hypothetical protein
MAQESSPRIPQAINADSELTTFEYELDPQQSRPLLDSC